MTKGIIFSWLCIVVFGSLVSVGEVGAVQVIQEDIIEPEQPEQVQVEQVEFLDRVLTWSCFDYSVKYRKHHPEWGIMIWSEHPLFAGVGNSHVVNYQITDNKELLIHDEFNQIEYTMAGDWHEDPRLYFHFYIDEEPTRQFKNLRPNAEEVFNEL